MLDREIAAPAVVVFRWRSQYTTRIDMRSRYDQSATFERDTDGMRTSCAAHQRMVDCGTPESADARSAV
jgi:hypothetical protein